MSAVTPWKVAVEEHVMLPEVPGDALLALMDECAIERMILAPGGTGVQAEPDPALATAQARSTNDSMADAIADRPDRWSAFATLPMQDPVAASDELERAVTELGFCGPLVNGYSAAGDPESALYYDARRYDVFWERLQSLGVPFYLHPRDPMPSQQRAYQGYPQLLGAAWAFGAETALHALRLIVGGVFDRFPRVQIVLGHLGETLPFAIGRAADRLRDKPLDIAKPVDAYFREHFHVTTSGHFNEPALVASIMEMGVDRLMFALDHPFANATEGNAWFDALDLRPADRQLLGRANAVRLFGLQEKCRAVRGTEIR